MKCILVLLALVGCGGSGSNAVCIITTIQAPYQAPQQGGSCMFEEQCGIAYYRIGCDDQACYCEEANSKQLPISVMSCYDPVDVFAACGYPTPANPQ